MTRSWLDEERSQRKYQLSDTPNLFWIVLHEYRPKTCSQCDDIQYLRLTHISADSLYEKIR